MLLSPGNSLGPYTVLDPLGAGGMGEVYRARDRRLGREVALKVLTDETSDDPDRLQRLEQEARAASSLNHPNVVVVYEIGEASLPSREHPIRFIAMELLKGEPLSSILAAGALDTRRFLDLAVQLADGLAAAHDSGLIHRDLKPSNVIVEPEGRVKMLDFGLAKLVPPHGHETSAPTVDPLTQPGTVLGTIGYMAPEQVRGEPATAASDQFSLGCLFYEMVTGRRAFQRPSRAETLSAILREEPRPIEELNPAVPPPIRWVVERCLAKSPRERYESTHDLVRDLQKLREHVADPVLRSSPLALRRLTRWRTGRMALLLMSAAALGAVACLWVYARLNHSFTPHFERLTFRRGWISRALFVPNSEAILYAAAWEGPPSRTYLTMPGATGMDRVLDSDQQVPLAYSADGTKVLTLLGESRPAMKMFGKLAWWPALGGRARELLTDAGWADWAKSGSFFVTVRNFGDRRTLELRDVDGALKGKLYETLGSISWVRISPDEKTIAFIHHPSPSDDGGEVCVVQPQDLQVRTLSGRFRKCTGLDWNRRTGQLWFTASSAADSTSALWWVDLKGQRGVVYALPEFMTLQALSDTGEQCLLVTGENRLSLIVKAGDREYRDLSWLGWSIVRDVSADGKTLLFKDGNASQKPSGVWIRPVEGGEAVYLGPGNPGRFSPDGRRVVATTDALDNTQIVLIPVEAGERVQVTSGHQAFSEPAFLDANTLICVAVDKGHRSLWRVAIPSGEARPLGVEGCSTPAPNAAGNAFLCFGGPDRETLFGYEMADTPRLAFRYASPTGDSFASAGWSASGDRVVGVTRLRRRITLTRAGVPLSDDAVEFPNESGTDSILRAAFSPDLRIQAFSVTRFVSSLYLCDWSRKRKE